MKELRKITCWQGEFQGVRFEIKNWQLGEMNNWNYYLHIPKEQIPDGALPFFDLPAEKFQMSSDDREHIVFKDYTTAPLISDLDWHGGMTWYDKHFNGFGEITGFELGCDYAHYWDKGHNYSLSSVQFDVERTINELWNRIPNLKLCCNWDGKYYDKSDMYIGKNGRCVANKNKEKYDAPITL